jgi:hypothetical protein
MICESLSGQLDIFVEHVVPISPERGIFQRDDEGPALRQKLRPASSRATGIFVARNFLSCF